MEAFVRTELLLGRDAIERLQQARVAVFGLGGVGGYVVEALARSGVGALDLIDHDTVSVSNLNRQIFALHSTIGRDKADVAKERVLDINPDIQVTLWKTFYLPDTADQFDLTPYDYSGEPGSLHAVARHPVRHGHRQQIRPHVLYRHRSFQDRR